MIVGTHEISNSNLNKLKKIEKSILSDLKCPLKKNAKNLVFGKGNSNADILFIGEAPGAKEDDLGIPFVGAAGKRLDGLLKSIKLSIDDIYIANILKYRPPKNRDPKVDEIRDHTPYLIKQIEVIKPKVVCTLGNFATKFVLAGFDVDCMKKISGISELHGKKFDILVGKNKYLVIPLYHPAAMMYKPSLKIEIEKDFKIISKLIK